MGGGMESFPRVLIVTVNPLSETSNNGKTFASFFEGYPKDRIAQLYFHRETPSSPICDNYYRISDEDIAAALISPVKRRVGSPATRGGGDEGPSRPWARDILKQSRFVRLLRSLLWTAVPVDSGAARGWIDSFDPEVVFFCGGDANHLYRKVEHISRRTGAPVVLYITDDYILPALTVGPFGWVTRRWTLRRVMKMARSGASIFTIGSRMSAVYLDRFGIASEPIMNLVSIPEEPPKAVQSNSHRPVVMSYVGALHSNRWRVLAELGDALGRQRRPDLSAELHIYSPTPLSPKAEASLTRSGTVVLHGAIPSDQVPAVHAGSDVLVHVEAFDRASRLTTALSVSTKIPEYLVARRCILAIGPQEVASVRYLEEAGAARVVSSLRDLDDAISELVSDACLRQHLGEVAFELAKANHDATTVRHLFWRRLREVARSRQVRASIGAPR